jgi:CHAD domain-containing protein
MAFCFKRKESVTRAIRRLGRKRIERALQCLKDCERSAAIHNARKEMKKAKAVLELARWGISKKKFRRIEKRLKKAAACLSDARDAEVIAKTLRDLTRRSKGQLSSPTFRDMRVELQDASRKARKRLVKKGGNSRAAKILRHAKRNFADIEIDDKEWDVIGRGVREAYDEGKAAHAIASENRSAEHFHQWRKAAKDLWYQVTLLEPIWPEQLDALAQELKTLGDCLGEDHDLFVLRCWLKERHGEKAKTTKRLTLLQQLIADRQRDLRTQALDIGKQFYEEISSAFCRRLETYWNTWRENKSSTEIMTA